MDDGALSYIRTATSDEVSGVGYLLELINPPDWHKDALCREHPELDWFPKQGDRIADQQSICLRCHSRTECLNAGMGEGFGIFGGMTVTGRRRLRRKRRRA